MAVFDRGLPVSVVMYHSVGEADDPYTVSPLAFRRQIECLARNFDLIRLRDLRRLTGRQDVGRRKVAITFDDAFCDFEETALPILLRQATPVTVFVPTAFVGKANEWDAPFTRCRRKPIMNAGALQRVKDSGLVDFGSHTVDHCRMSELSVEQMRHQVRGSKRALELTLSTPVDLFSYPYGRPEDCSRLTQRVLLEEGFTVAVTTQWTTRAREADLTTCGRISFNEGDDDRTVCAKVGGLYDWIGLKMQIGSRLRVLKTRVSRNATARRLGTVTR